MLLDTLINGFSDEIEKIATRKKKPAEEKDLSAAQRGFLGAGGSQMAMGLAQRLNNAAINDPVDRGISGTEQLLGDTARKMKVDPPRYFHHGAAQMGWMTPEGQAASNADLLRKDLRHYVAAPTSASEAAIAHELGHIKNDRLWGPVGRKLNVMSRNAAPLTGVAGSAIAATEKDPSWRPGLTSAAVAAPMLIDEGLASARAAKHLIGQRGLVRGVGQSLRLLPGYASYAAAGLAPLAITALRKKLRAKKEPSGSKKG